MKDFNIIKEYENGTKHYYNENNNRHRLIGPAIEWWNGDESYYINGICYIGFSKNDNELFIYPQILKLNSEYEKYIKQNIKDLIQEYKPQIKLSKYFEKKEINELPNWLKDLIIL